MMANGWKAKLGGALVIVSCIMLSSGCADVDRIGTGDNMAGLTGRPTLDQMVVSIYILEQAGFKKWPINYQTPERAALASSTPIGQITTFEMGGKVYHVYNDQNHNALYVGDQAAYESYLSLSHGKNVCRRVHGTNNAQFWSCYQEYEKLHK
jgi:hypothetical protein